ncbi:TIGR01244 family sulfur transferase [Rhodovulum sp. DZ06]|uniref:TIGR01244 family sulfur transferase n=1 Tax=Rhodovulum sp. DZ06 TaxID=3425126 RepID=UPI003D35966C
MDIRQISPEISVSPQITAQDVGAAAARGFRSIICNRPEGESSDQPATAEIQTAALAHGMAFRHIPAVSGQVTDGDAEAFGDALAELPGPVLAYCRSGMRSTTMWALSKAPKLSADAILAAAGNAGFDLSGMRPRLEAMADASNVVSPAAFSERATRKHRVVIVGGGAAGISTAASLLARRPGMDIAIIEPRDTHYYQPGWTLVGGGVFNRAETARPMADVMPKGVTWIRAAVAAFEPEMSQVVLEDGEKIAYSALVVAPGLKLNWDGVKGLRETLGKNGVTSNYMFDMAPYTWELVQSLKSGKAIFTQPPMPIKCAGAPQKAMYLSADHWKQTKRLKHIDIEFCNAGGALFGVADYVPALQQYIDRYHVGLNFNTTLVEVRGAEKIAVFKDGEGNEVEKSFDMLHVCPPQTAPDFIRTSPLANEAGWVEVSPETLQHTRYGDIFGLGDGCSAPNAKTAAAVRKQAPVVAENLIGMLDGAGPRAVYDGYGSCPLTVERGKIVLAEFGYGGKIIPSLPTWMIDGKKPSKLAWFLKEKMLPPLYWHAMLKGREWLAKPEVLPMQPAPHEAQDACDFQEARKAS